MSAAASLSSQQVAVEPGGDASITLTVRNTGSIVDEYTFMVVGEAAAWTTVDRVTVSLLPGDSDTVNVRFAPPRSSDVPAGELPFAVKVIPREQPDQSAVEEGVLDIAPFAELSAELVPRTSRGRRRGRHQLAIDNRGNRASDVSLSAADADEQLRFKLDRLEVSIARGQATFANLTVEPKKRFWRGPEKTLPFQVLVEPLHVDVPVGVDGTFVQQARIPKWLPKALLAALALLLALLALWFFLLRPIIESAAREAAEEEIAALESEQAAVAEQAAEAQEEAAAAQEEAAAAQEAASAAQESAGVAEESAVATAEQATEIDQVVARRDLGDPIDFRLGGAVDDGDAGSQAFTVPDDGTLALTDIVLQNPQGDTGLMQVRRTDEDNDTSTLIEVRLENFRDLDYHFVSPVFFGPGEALSVLVECDNGDGGACNAAAYVSGYQDTIEESETEAPPSG